MGKKLMWNDRWIKKPPEYKATPPVQNDPTLLRVSSLIEADTRMWNMEIIKDIFTEIDANIISNIYMSKSNKPDKLI